MAAVCRNVLPRSGTELAGHARIRCCGGHLVVAGSVWLLAWAQRRLTSDTPILVACARGAYAALILQVPVLIGLEIAARPIPSPGLAKGVLIGALAIAASFWLGWLLAGHAKLGKIL
jgi:hypothetical protein